MLSYDKTVSHRKGPQLSCVSGQFVPYSELIFADMCTRADSDRKWRHYQFFVSTQWPGGVYASPSIAGSRPGALLAGAWAAMLSMGRQGYLESCKQIVGAAKRIEAGIRADFPDLEVLGSPQVTVVAFKSDDLDIYAIGDKMSERGWHCMCIFDIS
jgi:glutamate/tyrosine decarboxylase-like PLP-dependent enzyme